MCPDILQPHCQSVVPEPQPHLPERQTPGPCPRQAKLDCRVCRHRQGLAFNGKAYSEGSGGLQFPWDLYSLRGVLITAQGTEERERDPGGSREKGGGQAEVIWVATLNSWVEWYQDQGLCE